MKKEEVPQDKSNLESADFRELCYAVDEDGSYVSVNSSGWEPKTLALSRAIERIQERIEVARQKVLSGESSPLEYFMEKHKMDVPVLASYAGIWAWRVKRHLRPGPFSKLNERMLTRYASVFEISVDALKTPDLSRDERIST